MQYYISLQFRLLKRQVEELGLPYWAVLILAIGAWLLFFHTMGKYPDSVPYVVMFIQLSLCLPLSNPERNNFLAGLFKPMAYRQVRILENLSVAVPFVLLCVLQGLYIFALTSLFICLLLATASFRIAVHRTLPAPFKRHPYEGQQFFRRFWWLLALLYLIAFMGVVSSNFNLGIFTIIVILFSYMSTIDHKEPEYYIWVYAKTPRTFIWQKIRRLYAQLTVLSAPIYIGLLVRFAGLFHITLLVWLSSALLLALSTVAVYSSYPRPISLPMGLLIGFCFIFPPLGLFVFPMLYKQACTNLKNIL